MGRLVQQPQTDGAPGLYPCGCKLRQTTGGSKPVTSPLWPDLNQLASTKVGAVQLKRIDARKARLDALRPLPAATVASLHDKLALEWTYNSNAIEGNTLTLRETQVVLEGVTVGGKSLREHLEAINHREAIGAVEELIQSGKAMTEWDVRAIHQIVLKGIDPEHAGRYRTENVAIVGASHTPPAAVLVPARMEELMQWLGGSASHGLHPVARTAEFHARFVEVHPFVDGNGRTGRLLMNAVLMQEGYPPAVIRKENRPAYYDALDHACVTKEYADITRLVAQETLRSLDSYLEVVEGRQPDRNGASRRGDASEQVRPARRTRRHRDLGR